MKLEEYDKRLKEVEEKINHEINELEKDIKRAKENIARCDRILKSMENV